MATASRPQNGNKSKRKGNHYAQIHRNPLPLEVFPLPAVHPTQPLSVLYAVWTYLRQWLAPPVSRSQRYTGYLSLDTRSVHITDPKHVRALWEQGFFGKGTLSRSEPTWIDREHTRLAAQSKGISTAEEATRARREERRLFKLERARLEREAIEAQRQLEQGLIPQQTAAAVSAAESRLEADETIAETTIDPLTATANGVMPGEKAGEEKSVVAGSEDVQAGSASPASEQGDVITQQEHLQLTLEEAFFLSFALGVLDIRSNDNVSAVSSDAAAFFSILGQISKFGSSSSPAVDDRFVLNYVVYHHFRSLGWVVRPGVKFSVDYLLYNRGPVFSHAEFAILIMPAYTHPFWSTEAGRSQRRLEDQKDWWWLHCINRVQSQVKKTMVLCYVDIPPPDDDLLTREGVAAVLKRYKVREFIVRRWLMNRSRD